MFHLVLVVATKISMKIVLISFMTKTLVMVSVLIWKSDFVTQVSYSLIVCHEVGPQMVRHFHRHCIFIDFHPFRNITVLEALLFFFFSKQNH